MIFSSETRPSGVKNNNNPVRIITFSGNRRLRRKCCLNVVLEHPGTPNRWRRTPQEHPKGNQETPKRHRRATKSTRSEAKTAPRAPKRKPRKPSRAPRQFLSKRPEITEVKIVLPPRRGHDFRCQRRGEGRTSFQLIFGALAGALEIPWGFRSVQKTLAMINSIYLETIPCFSSCLVSVKPHRTGRFTPCEPSSKRF